MNSFRSRTLYIWLILLGVLVVGIVSQVSGFLCGSRLVECGKATMLAAPFSEKATIRPTGSSEELVEEMFAQGQLRKGFSEWHVAPGGSPSGTGKRDSPFDLASALAGSTTSAKIMPGDIVWVHGGVYKGTFTTRVSGTPQYAVHFRQFPGERAVLDKGQASREVGTLSVRSPYLWFWDFEVANSHPDRGSLDEKRELNPWRGSGINVWAPNTKYINLVVRDNGHGFGLWNEEGGTEIYGCLIFNNGNNKKEHGIYAHNREGSHVISDNLIFNNAGYGLHIYANSTKSAISGFEIIGNVVFNNGALTGVDQVADQILVGGVTGVSAGRITVVENSVYNNPDGPTSKNRGIRLGYEDTNNHDVSIRGNYIVSNIPLRVLWWRSAEAIDNTIRSAKEGVEVQTGANAVGQPYTFARNNYQLSGRNSRAFNLNGERLGIEEWRGLHRTDANDSSDLSKEQSLGAIKTILRKNKFDKRRAHLIVHNRHSKSNVTIKLDGFLSIGDTYEIYDAQNIFAPPLIRSRFDGKGISMSLASQDVMLPLGATERRPMHSKEDFGVFVIYKVK